MTQNTLSIERILDYCDVPQLFIGRDCFDTQYLCLLYDDDPICKYTAIRISSMRYAAFARKEKDLRTLFLQPEFDKEYFDVVFDGKNYLTSPLAAEALAEDRLPAEGYYLDDEESDTITISVPKRERSIFDRLIHRYGWVAM